MNYKKRFIIPLLISSYIGMPQLNASQLDHDFIESEANRIYHELVEFRRDLYAHPEASGEEKRTSAKVAQYLLHLGLEVKTNVGGYGVVGILKGGKEGKRIAWRADMDAAYFEYSHDDHIYGEHNALKHVCGHDVHTAIGLGIANVLSQKVDDLSGTVYFLFQPAEENQRGAKAMISDGLYELIEPDEIYGLHVAPMATGLVSTRSGNVFAHARRIRISFDGVEDSEAITQLVGSAINDSIRVKEKVKFDNLNNITDSDLGISNPDTIYQDYVTFHSALHTEKLAKELNFGTEVYLSNLQELDHVVAQIKQKIDATEYKDRLRSVEYFHEREGVDNNEALVKSSTAILSKLFGDQVISESFGQMPLASEDFGHFQRKVPGVYFFIGASNERLGISAFPHMPEFSVDEMVIQVGVSYFASLIFERVNSQ